jgi:hypothetical protein
MLATALVLLISAAHAGEQKLVYDLVLGGKKVGKRELTVRHLPPEEGVTGASRLIESWTELDATVAGQHVVFQGRASIRATDSRLSYNSIFDQNGDRVEVQGRQSSDGSWTITRADSAGVHEQVLRRSEVDLSTFHLLDPKLHELAEEAATANILIAETGTIAQGPARQLGEDTVQISGEGIPVTRWEWDPTGGRMEVAWTMDGLPIQYSLKFLGQRLTATARAVPQSNWGSVDVQTFQTSSGGAVLEEEL